MIDTTYSKSESRDRGDEEKTDRHSLDNNDADRHSKACLFPLFLDSRQPALATCFQQKETKLTKPSLPSFPSVEDLAAMALGTRGGNCFLNCRFWVTIASAFLERLRQREYHAACESFLADQHVAADLPSCRLRCRRFGRFFQSIRRGASARDQPQGNLRRLGRT